MDGERGKITCQIRYTLNLSAREAFIAYAELWVGLVERYGGTHLGYYIPRDAPNGTQISFPGLGQEGPRDVAIALFTFPDEKSYLAYRAMAAVDPDCIKAEAIVRDTACFTSYERLFLEALAER